MKKGSSDTTHCLAQAQNPKYKCGTTKELIITSKLQRNLASIFDNGVTSKNVKGLEYPSQNVEMAARKCSGSQCTEAPSYLHQNRDDCMTAALTLAMPDLLGARPATDPIPSTTILSTTRALEERSGSNDSTTISQLEQPVDLQSHFQHGKCLWPRQPQLPKATLQGSILDLADFKVWINFIFLEAGQP